MALPHIAWCKAKLKLLNSSLSPFVTEEAVALHQHWHQSLDDGALRCLYWYLKDLPNDAFFFIAYRFYIWYFDEDKQEWLDRNASACLVVTLRYTFFYDREFICEWLVE